MKYTVRITGPAKGDLQGASKYISDKLNNRDAARKLALEAGEAMRSLDKMPQRHALVSDEYLSGLGIRFFPVRNYLVFYIVREETKTVVIERFLYGKSDWASILKGDDIPEDT